MAIKSYEKQRKFAGCDAQKLNEAVETTNRTVDKSLKNVAERLFTSLQMKPLCKSTVTEISAKGKLEEGKKDSRFYVRIGKTAAFSHSNFRKKIINSKVSNFITHLEIFYDEKFKANERPFINK